MTFGQPGNFDLPYNRTSGAFEGDFVTAGSGGLAFPTYIAFAPAAAPEPSAMTFLVSLGLAIARFVVRRKAQPDVK